MNIYQNIARICREKNISIAKLEREMNMANGTLNRWRVINPSVYAVAEVADHLQVSLDELCGREVKQDILDQAIEFVQEQNKLTQEENMMLMMLRTMTDEQKKNWLYEGMKIKYGSETR